MLFVVLVCVFLWKPIFRGEALLPGDYLMQMEPWSSAVHHHSVSTPQWNPLQWDAIAQYYPWRVFYARSMRSGHIPLWNPHQFCGTPFLANGQSAVLYPLNLIFLIFDPITAFTIFAALHLFLAQVFMYWLLRELGVKELGGIVGAITFAFSAFMVLWLELPTFISAAIYVPLSLLLIHRAVERRSSFYGMLSGVAISLAFLAGHFQIAFYVAMAAGLWWIWKLIEVWRAEGKIEAFLRVVIPAMACLLIAGLISAPQVLPTLELARVSHRAGNPTADGYDWFLANAAQPYRLITALAPKYFGDPSEGTYFLLGMMGRHAGSAADYMEYGMYAGVLPLMLAFLALGSVFKRKYIGFFALLAIFSMLIATGTPINYLFYWFMPGFSSLGGPNRILLLYIFSVAVLAAFGVERFLENPADKVKVYARGRAGLLGKKVKMPMGWIIGLQLFITCVILGGCVVMGTQISGIFPDSVSKQIEIIGELPWAVFMVLGLAGFLVMGLRGWNIVRDTGFGILAIALIITDLFLFGINYNPVCLRSEVYPRTRLTDELKRLTKDGQRIAPINPIWSLFQTPKTILPPNSAMVYGLYDVQGYDSLFMRAYKDKLAQVIGEDPSPVECGNMVLAKQPADDIQELAQYIVTGSSPLMTINAASKPAFWENDEVSDSLAIIKQADAYYDSPSRIVFRIDNSGKRGWAESVGTRVMYCPGWAAETCTEIPLDFDKNEYPFMAVHVGDLSDKESMVIFKYEPFTFRFSLFLMLLGVGTLTCTGVYRAKRYKIKRKR